VAPFVHEDEAAVAKRKRGQEAPCAYCDSVEELTLDHVIPRCLFGEKKDQKAPPDTPVVYACRRCNGDKKSLDDSYLRDMLVCDMDSWQHPVARRLAEGAFTRAFLNGQSALARDIAKKLRPIEVFTPSGLYAGIAYGAEMPQGRISRVLATMVRGLYAYYTDARLPENAEFTVHRIRDLARVMPIVQMALQMGALRYVPVGDSTIFNCIYGVEPGQPELSMWFLGFYSNSVFRVTTRAASTDRGLHAST
jgi:hypothetical protein